MSTNYNVNIVLGSDMNNIWGLAVTVKSLLNKCSRTCNVFILSINIPIKVREQLKNSWDNPNVGKIQFLDIEEADLDGLRPTMYLKVKSPYSRFLIGRVLPKNINRCIYLDTDLIVNSDICQLNDTDIGDSIIGAIPDVCIKHLTTKLRNHLNLTLGLENPEAVFNAGVLLIDLMKWREQNIGEKACEFGRKNYDITHAQDQDILNVILEGKWKKLSEKWNQSQYLPQVNEKEGIIHLIGKRKPWDSDYSYHYKNKFFEILDTTEFRGCRPFNFLGLGYLLKCLERNVPTTEILKEKICRLIKRLLGKV